jgi:hypothetical protein
MVATTAHTFLDISDAGWSAIAACGGLLLAIAAAIFGYRQFREARRTREEQAQPYVAISMEPTEPDPNAVDLIIKNYGETAARDVEIEFDPPLKSSLAPEDVKVPGIIHTLVPGQAWTTFWDTAIQRKDSELPDHYTATIRFKNMRGKQLGPYTFDLDWNQIIDRGWIVTHGMHALATAIREIRDEYKHRGDRSYSHVLVYSGDERDRRERERWEQVTKEQQQEQEQEQQTPEESSD